LPEGAAARREAVKLGKLEAFRYQGLRPKGFAGVVTVYVVPQSTSAALIVCHAASGAGAQLLPDCAQIAAGVKLAGYKPYPLGLPAGYARTVNGALGDLADARTSGIKGLREAETAAAQAQAAGKIGSGCRAGLRRLRGAVTTPLLRPAHDRIVQSLNGTCSAYAALGAAAKAQDKARYDQARQAVARSEARLTTDVAALKELGFRT
jgi:hypothetical protein